MKIIISPAKIMQEDLDSFPVQELPEMLTEAKQLNHYLQSLNDEQLNAIWQINEKLFQKNKKQLENFSANRALTPAIIAFIGLQYKYMAPDLFTQAGLDYAQKNLRILSGLYGILRPFDGIKPYRLEMGSKISLPFAKNLYDFWSDKIYNELYKKDDVVINLASTEYSRIVKKYVKSNQKFITVNFLNKYNGKWRIIGTYSKIARGSMVRYICENQIDDIEKIKDFNTRGAS